MQASVFHTACWKFPCAFIKIEFGPTHARHLASALACDHQQFEERSKRVALGFGVSPYSTYFVINEHAITLDFTCRRSEESHRRRFDGAAHDAPVHEFF